MKTARIETIFQKAEKEGRSFLLEHEVYALLRTCGIQAPRFVFVKKGGRISKKDLAVLRSRDVVIKIVCPLIAHKTDVGGVRFVENKTASVNRAIEGLLAEVPKRLFVWTKKTGRPGGHSLADIDRKVRGVLVLEKVEYEKTGFGSELLLGLWNSREFGPVVTMGLGGVDVEYVNERLRTEAAVAIGSPHLLRRGDISSLLKPLAFFDKLTGEFRGREPLIDEDEIVKTYETFLKLAAHFSSLKKSSVYAIEEAEVNPFVVRKGRLVPLDGLCRFSRRHEQARPRIFLQLDFLLHPQSIGIIGVSEKMNLGHVILNNILREGFPKDRVTVVKPGLSELEGCRCVPDVSALPEAVDLFVLTLAADQSVGIMDELLAAKKARSVVIIAGGMGEKKGTEVFEDKIKGLLRRSRREGELTPVVNGGNCMGIYSCPGRYDTTFIPEYKLAAPGKKNPRIVYVSQSGAFMAARMSKLPQAEPLYAVSLGNQIDLTASDYLNYLKTREDAALFALYIEGFQPGDGLALAEAAGEIIRKGKTVVLYKSGRTAEGRKATASHTASVAGDYAVCRSILESAGVFVAADLREFENALESLLALAGKVPRGKRVGLISNAGFECVILADSLKDGYGLELAPLSEKTKERIIGLLRPLGIDRLQDVRNPLDITPVADDAVFAGCVEALLSDERVDCAVVSPVPMTAALQTLAPSTAHREDLCGAQSIGHRLADLYRQTSKPFVVNIDAGPLYQPLAGLLEEAGVPTFRRSDEALRFLSKYIHTRLRGAKHRKNK